MKKVTHRTGLYPALLKYWRHKRGMSQLDLSSATDVSARHISFLETGRAQPSEEMLLLLAANLNMPLRSQNHMLQAAGFNERFIEPRLSQGLDPEISMAIERMLSQHEPFPIMVMNQCYDVLRMNHAMERLLRIFIKNTDALGSPINAYQLFFDPQLARDSVVNWAQTGRKLLSRLNLESLRRPEETSLRVLLEELLAYPDVQREWLQPDFSSASSPTYQLRFRNDKIEVAFLTTITTFSSPGNITLEELRIESYFPLNESTEVICEGLAAEKGSMTNDK